MRPSQARPIRLRRIGARRTADLVPEIRDIDYLEAESEVDALLSFNSDLKDDNTFPYPQITTHED